MKLDKYIIVAKSLILEGKTTEDILIYLKNENLPLTHSAIIISVVNGIDLGAANAILSESSVYGNNKKIADDYLNTFLKEEIDD
jgi:hypothetical protein